MKSPSAWDIEQEKQGIPLIDRTFKVMKPNGKVTEVNCFDFNLASSVDPNTYVQCSDTSWIRCRNLRVLSHKS